MFWKTGGVTGRRRASSREKKEESSAHQKSPLPPQESARVGGLYPHQVFVKEKTTDRQKACEAFFQSGSSQGRIIEELHQARLLKEGGATMEGGLGEKTGQDQLGKKTGRSKSMVRKAKYCQS